MQVSYILVSAFQMPAFHDYPFLWFLVSGLDLWQCRVILEKMMNLRINGPNDRHKIQPFLCIFVPGFFWVKISLCVFTFFPYLWVLLQSLYKAELRRIWLELSYWYSHLMITLSRWRRAICCIYWGGNWRRNSCLYYYYYIVSLVWLVATLQNSW